MDQKEIEYLNHFQQRLEENLLKLCYHADLCGRQLLTSADIDERWLALAPEYMSDAVPEIASYPTVSVAWALYLGMAVAKQWDGTWEKDNSAPYQSYYGRQGYDDMDENICYAILGIERESEEAQDLNNAVRRLAETTVASIRHEQIEPQSSLAFHIFARACNVMYRIGANLELYRLGYKFERMDQ